MIESNLRNVKILSEQDKKEWKIINQVMTITDCVISLITDCVIPLIHLIASKLHIIRIKLCKHLSDYLSDLLSANFAKF